MSYKVFACKHVFMCVCMSEICLLQVDSCKNCDDVKCLEVIFNKSEVVSSEFKMYRIKYFTS
jgi:hypothetical protein